MDYNTDSARAGSNAGQLSQKRLEEFLADIRNEPEWRREADIEASYYDGNQLSSEVLLAMKERGLAPLVRNYIRPTLDLALGMEARNKRDILVNSDDDSDPAVAEALTQLLKKADRETQADLACSEAYASQLKVGIGWVEVSRESNPFKGRYRVKAVHRREIWWDWRARELDLSDARFLVRRKWYDTDVLVEMFPKHKTLIERSVSTADWDDVLPTDSPDLLHSFDVAKHTTLEASEWLDCERGRLCLYEVWYRVWKRGLVLRLQDGTVLEFDEKNLRHQVALATGAAEVSEAAFPAVRLSWWVGPHRLSDVPSPYPHGFFPYVPFWGYREDATGVPYGLIRSMKSPQDEINARLSKMMWLLTAKRIIADSDAADMPWDQVVDEAARPDALIRMNPQRTNRNADALRVEVDVALSAQQFEVMRDATQAIQDAAGIYQAMLGKESSAESGVAINSLVEQGSTTLAEVNDNYRASRTAVHELLLALIREDLAGKQVDVAINKKRSVSLNSPIEDVNGFTGVENSVTQFRGKVALSDVPDTPSHREHMFQLLVELTKSMAPEAQPLFSDFLVKVSNLPSKDKEELTNRLRNAFNLPLDPEEMSPEELAAQQEQQAKAAEAEQLMMDEQRAKVSELQAKVDKLLAEVEKIRVDTELAEQQQVFNEDLHSAEVQQAQKEAESPIVDADIKLAKADQEMGQSDDMHSQRMRHTEDQHRVNMSTAASRFKATQDQGNALHQQKFRHNEARFSQAQSSAAAQAKSAAAKKPTSNVKR